VTVSFERHFTQRLADAYRWDLWGLAYQLNGGCSDDGFVYFRCWLLGQGRPPGRRRCAGADVVPEGIVHRPQQ
jgi:hypothetical protein